MATSANRWPLSQRTMLTLAVIGIGFAVGAMLFFFLVPIMANPVVPILIGGLIGAGVLGLLAWGVWKFVKHAYKAEPAPLPSAQDSTPKNNDSDDKTHSHFYSSNEYAASNGPTAESTPSTHVPAYVLPQPKQDAELVKALNEIETLFKKAKSDFATSLIGVEADKIKQEPGFCFSEAQKTELNGHLMAALQQLEEGFKTALNDLDVAKQGVLAKNATGAGTSRSAFEEIEAAIHTEKEGVTAVLRKTYRIFARLVHPDKKDPAAAQEYGAVFKAVDDFFKKSLVVIDDYIESSLGLMGQGSGQASAWQFKKWQDDEAIAEIRKEQAERRKEQAKTRETLAQTNAERNTAFRKIDAALTRLERQQQENLAANASTDEKQINTMPLVTANDALSPSAAAFLPSLSAAPSSAANDPNASVVVLASALSNGKNYAPTMNGPN